MERSNFGGRIIVALMIVFIGWIMYMSQVEKNPVTGERQHVSLSPDQEIRLGLESAPEMAKEMGGELPSTDPRTDEVEKMGEYLVDHSDAQKSPWKFKFHLIADKDTVNAFALPGGQIFITLGLYDKLQNEAQLAGVLGHEMGHVIERHTAQQMAKTQLGQMFVVAVGAAASDPNNPSGSYGSVAIASLVNQMFQLRYSRRDESEADLWGLKIMEQSGFNPKAMIQVMEILKAAGGNGQSTPDFFKTHPNPDLRIRQIKAYLEKHPPQAGLKDGGSLIKTDDAGSEDKSKSLMDYFSL
jgi:beta-barrel assembly-enhancing protease